MVLRISSAPGAVPPSTEAGARFERPTLRALPAATRLVAPSSASSPGVDTRRIAPSAASPPAAPPSVAPIPMRPMYLRALCGSKRSVTSDQKPLTRTEPSAATCK
ncbi:MAG: hypothetical protein IPG04_07575 [Polyangiaceae bacterium]|nr:hypothetical protein [Polyangiaceae bacterium]